MKNRKGFCFINILLQISLILLLLSFGFIYFKKLIEREELIRAKTEIYEVFTTYGIKAHNSRTNYEVKLDYLKKNITISQMSVIDKEIIHLPQNLKYITIFHKPKKNLMLKLLLMEISHPLLVFIFLIIMILHNTGYLFMDST